MDERVTSVTKLRLLPNPLGGKCRESTTNCRRVASSQMNFPEEDGDITKSVGIDADSTAYAILFLASEGFSIPHGSYDRLKSFQRQDGGFFDLPTVRRCWVLGVFAPRRERGRFY